MLLQGGCWPPGFQFIMDYDGAEIEWLYPFDDGGAAVVALTGQGPFGTARLCTRTAPAGGGGHDPVVCARVDISACIVPGEGVRTSLSVLSGPTDGSCHPVRTCMTMCISLIKASGSLDQLWKRSQSVPSAVAEGFNICRRMNAYR
jgi:hypothetical protein